MNIAQINSLPEPGQIVEVRALRYTVTDIAYTSTPDDYQGKLGSGCDPAPGTGARERAPRRR